MRCANRCRRTAGAALAAALLAASLGPLLARTKAAPGRKIVIVLQAGTAGHEGKARALHALLYASELREHGHEAVLLFDGAGTQWAARWAKAGADDRLAAAYRELRAASATVIVCDHCAGAFGVRDDLRSRDAPLAAEYRGHPSLARWVDRGFEIVIL